MSTIEPTSTCVPQVGAMNIPVRTKALFGALRMPIFLLVGCILLIFSETLIPNLIGLYSYYTSSDSAEHYFEWRADKLLYISNVVILLGCLLGSFALLEVKHLLVPRNKNLFWDLITILVWLAFALTAPLLSSKLGGGLGSLRTAEVQVSIIWLFMVLNSNLYLFDRLLHKLWCSRLFDWTFPVSDIVFYMFHRERIGGSLGPVKFVPTMTYVLALLLCFAMGIQVLWQPIRAERMIISRADGTPIRFVETNQVKWSDGGFWFSSDGRYLTSNSNSNSVDIATGLWFYDESTGRGDRHFPASDLRTFCLDEGFIYFYDRSSSEILKVDAQTKQVIWRVSIRRGFGTFDVALHDGRLFAAGESGYITALDKNSGRVLAERIFPHKTEELRAPVDGRVAFIIGDTNIRLLNSDLTDSETIPLPLPNGVFRFDALRDRSRLMRVATWIDYVEDSNTLYVATFWGEVFRYDFNLREWLPSFKAKPGIRSCAVDSQNSLLFTANYFGGFIEIFDLQSRHRLKYVLAGSLGRYISLNSEKKTGILNTKGWGMYRFDYSDLVPARQVAK